jgi:amino acid adenylation domain-containing protein
VQAGKIVAPSSFSQRRLWMLDRLYGQRASYNVTCAYRLAGPLDIARLQRSLDAIVRRHEVLRTSFRLEGDDVLQVIRPDLSVPIPVQDLGHVPESRRFHAAVEQVAIDAARPFDLESAPLVRVRLYRLGEQDHLLALNFHHAVFDGWSEGVFLTELAALYQAGAGDEGVAILGELPIQYRDFAVWQRETASGPAAQASLEVWRERLTGAPAVLNLPSDYPRPSEPTHRGGQELLFLSPAEVDTLSAVGRRHSATLFMTLLAAYSVVLHRYSGDREVTIGTVLAGRTRVEIERLIGFFINTVALRVDLGDETTFVALLERIKESSLEAHAHQDVPFERVVESLHPRRLTGQMPLFQTIFVLQGGTSRRLAVGDLRFEPLEIHNGTSKCDLVLSVGEAKDGREGLCCSLEYDADLFKPETVARLLESYRCVLRAVSDDPKQAVSGLPIVGPTDRALIERWSHTPAEYPRESTIHRQFEATAARTPSAVAVTGQAESLTYTELDARANRLAARLRREGVQRGDLVGLCLERTIEAIVAELAVLKAGAAYLPLDPAYPASRLGFMLQDARVRVVLSHTNVTERLSSGAAKIIALDQEAGVIEQESAERCADECGADDLAYVMYTSGSTGRPNGVRVPHRGVLRLVLGTTYVCWDKAGTFLQMAPLSFDASTFEVWGPLLHGRRLVVFPDRVPTVPILGDVLRAEGVDCLWLPSALFNVVIDQRPECLAGVSQLIVGGEALSVPHVRLAQARLPLTQLINGYGPTECTTFSCCYPIPRVDEGHAAPIPIGRPIGNTSVLVLDARHQPVPIGVVGELYIGGDGVALGYHNRPHLTAERFVPDPTGRSARLWYRTGDRARWRPEGVLEFHGRLDAQVKVRGFRVEPGEIEAACRRHPGVRDAGVVLENSATDARLVAFIVAEPGLALTAQDLSRSLADQLPSHLVPADIVVLDALPLTPNGKVDRQALSSRCRSLGGGGSMPPRRGGPPTRVAAPPRNASEEALSRIWRDLLRLDSVGIHDDFFALGGHSLLAVQMFSQIHDAFGRSLPFSSLVRHSTIAELAALLASGAAPGGRSLSLVPLKESGSRPPLFLMHGIGNEVWTFLELAKHLDVEQPVFGVLPSEHAANRAASLTERAAAYVSDLEAILPQGPFALGGHCSGAVTAFEVARQLQARGRNVSLLVVFDHWLEETPIGLLTFANNAVTWVADDLLRTTLRDNVGRVRSRLRLLKTRLLNLVDERTPPSDVRDLLGMWRYPDHEVDRLREEIGAIRAYRFGQYDGAIHVFRARTRVLVGHKHPTPDLGWGRVAAGRLSVETVPGSHDSMFRPPFVRTLGERLDAVLERAFHDADARSTEVARR